jgi:dipeptidyl aminopeptidase/acylaminoacyl peptidase
LIHFAGKTGKKIVESSMKKTRVKMKKTFVIIFAVVFAFAFFCNGETNQTKKTLSYDEIIKIHRISNPQISHNGRMVTFDATQYSFETNKGTTRIWEVPLEGGQANSPIGCEQGDSNSKWSPDSTKIAVLREKEGIPQIFIYNASEFINPLQLTNLPTGVDDYKWSPKGDYIIFHSQIFPECTDMECNARRLKEEESKKVSAIVSDTLLYRHWNFWKAGKANHLFSVRLSDLKVTDLTPGTKWVPFGPFQGAEQYCVSPEGKTVVFSRRTGNTEAWDTNDDLYSVPIDGGSETQLTTAKGSETDPAFSPGGKYMSYIRMKRPGFESDTRELVLIETSNGNVIELTAGYDGDVDEYAWTPDEKTIYFSSESRGRKGLYKVALADKKVTRLYQNGVINGIAITPDSNTIVFLYENSMRPKEVYKFDLKKNNPVRLTNLNEELMSNIEMNPVEDFDFRASGGDMVHGFLLKPPYFDKNKKYPMIYIIHGGPQGSTRDEFHYRWNLQMFAARGYVVAAVNFHGSSGYGQKFEDSITYDWGGKPYRDLMKGIEHLTNMYSFINPQKIGAAGASYGGYMINWIAGHTDKFKCLVSHSGVYNLASMYGATEELWFPEFEYRGTPWTNPSHYREMSPSTYAANFKTPTLVIHGQKDFRVPVTQGMEFFTALQRQGVPSRFIYFPDEYHFVAKPNNARFWYNQVLDWMDKYLKKDQ